MNVPKLRFGEFEDEWQKVELGHLTKNISSGKSKPNSDSGFPVYGSMGVIGYSSEFTHSGKTLLIARVGANAGTTNIVEGEISVTDNTLIVSLNHSNTSEFICVLLQRENLNQMAFGSGQPLITAGQLKKLNIYIPEETEQQKIADFLSAVDEKITALTAQKTALTQYKQGMMQRIFSQTLRFKNDNGADYPEWEVKYLKNVSAIYDGTHMTPDYQASGVPFYSVEHVTSDNFNDTKFISAEVFEKECKRVKIEKNDILMTRIGDIGTSKLIDWDVKASFYVSLALIKPFTTTVGAYLNQYIRSSYFQRELYQRTIHVAFPKKINLGEIGECVVKLPNFDEQTKIAQLLTELDDKINAVDAQIQSAQQWKQGLLQQMFV